MKFKIKALSDSDPKWNCEIEQWWSQGGALLWNRFGGFGSEVIILDEYELSAFFEAASLIPNWQKCDGDSENEKLYGPFVVSPWDENAKEQLVSPQVAAVHRQLDDTETICCRSCGRNLRSALRNRADSVSISPRALNHLLNSLDEAISFAKGCGPNNHPTWTISIEEVEAEL